MHSSKLPIVKALAGLVLASILVLGSGCFLVAVGAAGAAGAGTVAYIRGELDASLGSRLDSVVGASERAVADLRFAKISETRDAFSAVIIARTAQDQKITITVTKEGDLLTKVQIRIGLFGDEPKSRAILDRIKAEL